MTALAFRATSGADVGDDAAVVVDDLSARYRAGTGRGFAIALTGVSLSIPAGGTLAVVGEAGSGKSTLARAIAGLTDRSRQGGPSVSGGGLRVLGIDVRHLRARDADELALRIGYVPQDSALVLDPHLTAGENVAVPLYERNAKLTRRTAGGIVAEAIDAMHLTLATIPKYPHELSRGQRQRVALARALVLDPDLVVADEPTAGVDATVRSSILDHLAEVQRRRGFTVFVVSSEIGEVRRLSDNLAVLHRGTMVGMGLIDDVLGSPTHPYTHQLAALAYG